MKRTVKLTPLAERQAFLLLKQVNADLAANGMHPIDINDYLEYVLTAALIERYEKGIKEYQVPPDSGENE